MESEIYKIKPFKKYFYKWTNPFFLLHCYDSYSISVYTGQGIGSCFHRKVWVVLLL